MNASNPSDTHPGDLKAFVFALFFAFGGITSLNDILIPKLKSLFTLYCGILAFGWYARAAISSQRADN
jgi:fucose permease